MCMIVICGQCRMRTWGGCGRHIAQVMAQIPEESRCRCAEQVEATAHESVAQPAPEPTRAAPAQPAQPQTTRPDDESFDPEELAESIARNNPLDDRGVSWTSVLVIAAIVGGIVYVVRRR